LKLVGEALAASKIVKVLSCDLFSFSSVFPHMFDLRYLCRGRTHVICQVYGWEPSIVERIQKTREEELAWRYLPTFLPFFCSVSSTDSH
jgi:hypothetical protein